jgi:virginiamycin B lyase
MREVRQRIRVALAPFLAFLLLTAVPGSAGAYPPLADAQLFELAPSVHASAVAFAPDGSLWFAGAGYLADTTVVGRVSPTGEVSELEVPGSSPGTFGATAIVAGPDGAMWFTQFSANAIGRVDAGGQVTQFALPSGGGPSQIVAGPDGALWFTESNAGRVGRITTTGEASEFQLGPRSEPVGIAVGPDGALWVTEKRASKIVRLAPAGDRTVFPLAPGIEPTAIVAGPGGLWFTEGWKGFGSRGANKLGRIAVNGTVKQFRVPARFGTGEIAVGPEGRVWFTTGPRRAAIESISATGKVGDRVCLERACTLPPSSLAFAPDGALWFGTQVYACVYCGGGSGLMALQYPGNVGFLRSR